MQYCYMFYVCFTANIQVAINLHCTSSFKLGYYFYFDLLKKELCDRFDLFVHLSFFLCLFYTWIIITLRADFDDIS